MNKKVKKVWLDALRSGEYKQGRNRLCAQTKDDDGQSFKEIADYIEKNIQED